MPVRSLARRYGRLTSKRGRRRRRKIGEKMADEWKYVHTARGERKDEVRIEACPRERGCLLRSRSRGRDFDHARNGSASKSSCFFFKRYSPSVPRALVYIQRTRAHRVAEIIPGFVIIRAVRRKLPGGRV